MTNAHNLFEYQGCSTKLAHRGDPQTSVDAAKKMIKSGKLNKQQEEVSNIIQHYYNRFGRTDYTAKELAEWTKQSPIYNHIDYYIIQRRLHEISHIERIQIGETPAGKAIYKKRNGCCVWALTKT